MELHNFCPPTTPITEDGKVDVTEKNFPSNEEIQAARRAVEKNRSTSTQLG